MAKPTTTQPIIQWRDVILLDTTVAQNDPYRSATVAALDKLQFSATGQKLFAELQATQQHIPDNFRWANFDEIKRLGRKLSSDISAPMETALHHRAPTDDNKKLYVAIVTASVATSHLGDTNFYYFPFHTLGLIYPGIFVQESVRENPITHAKMHAPTPLDEALSHEIQHAIDWLNQQFNHGPTYSATCGETRAVATQHAYGTEVNPRGPQRTAYTDPEFDLENYLSWHSAAVTKTLVTGMAYKIKLTEGCDKNLTYEQVMEQMRTLFEKHHIQMGDVPPGQIGEWIRNSPVNQLFPPSPDNTLNLCAFCPCSSSSQPSPLPRRRSSPLCSNSSAAPVLS